MSQELPYWGQLRVVPLSSVDKKELETETRQWYTHRSRASASSTIEWGQLRKIQKRAAKRRKYYSSDSSASEKSAASGHKENHIYRASGKSYDYFVYHKGKKITFGDSSMPNRQDNDGARANFNARHRCSEKKDKSKASYWACRVWRKGYRGPSSDKKKKG